MKFTLTKNWLKRRIAYLITPILTWELINADFENLRQLKPC